jgi:hypothetical protein
MPWWRSPHDEPVAKLDFTIDRARRALLAQQHPEGYWQGALEVNAEINAEYIIFNRFMELPADPELDRKLAKQILETQQGDGSWALFPGGEGDLSTTIEAYFGLKLTGMRAGDEPLDLPHRLEEAEVLRFHANMLLQRNLAGDRERARNMLARAAESYDRMAMPRHLELARTMLEKAA